MNKAEAEIAAHDTHSMKADGLREIVIPHKVQSTNIIQLSGTAIKGDT